MTLKSICTSYELTSHKNFNDSNKRVAVTIYKENLQAHIVCSKRLSKQLRDCKNGEELSKLLTRMGDFRITNQIIAGE